ncbi:hypothetical protein P4281_20060, partial [Bacillus thuringiensis]|nr:hypothetical protein [Bacillus thuringiensis]
MKKYITYFDAQFVIYRIFTHSIHSHQNSLHIFDMMNWKITIEKVSHIGTKSNCNFKHLINKRYT